MIFPGKRVALQTEDSSNQYQNPNTLGAVRFYRPSDMHYLLRIWCGSLGDRASPFFTRGHFGPDEALVTSPTLDRKDLAEVRWPQGQALQCVPVEHPEECAECLIQHARQAATAGDHALVAGGEALDERKVRLGRAHHIAKHDLVGRPGKPQAAGPAPHGGK